MSQDRDRKRIPAIILAGALALGLVSGVGAHASAATIPVTTWAELVAAIDAANLDPDVDTITLTGVDADYVADPLLPLPPITTPVHVIGPGSTQLTIDLRGSYTVNIDGVDEASVTGLRLINGYPNGLHVIDAAGIEISDVVAEGAFEYGLLSMFSSVTVHDSAFIANGTWGAWAEVSASDVVSIIRTTIERNTLGLGFQAGDSGSLIVTDVTVDDNDDVGVHVSAHALAEVAISNLQSFGNGDIGIAINLADQAALTATNVRADENVQSGMSVYLSDESRATLTDTTVDDNHAQGWLSYTSLDSDLTVNGMSATGNGWVANVSGVVFNTIDDAVVTASDLEVADSRGDGVSVSGGGDSYLTFDQLEVSSSSGQAGVVFNLYENSTVAATEVLSSDNDGNGVLLEVSDAATLTVTDAVSRDNEFGGFYVEFATTENVAIRDSSSLDNGARGFTVSTAGHTGSNTFELSGSTVAGNDDTGIYASGGGDSAFVFYNNTISGNALDPFACVAGFAFDGSEDSHVALVHSTIVDNEPGNDCVQANFNTVGEVVLSHNIIAGTVWDLGFTFEPTVLTLDYTLVQSTGADAFVTAALAAGTGNLNGVDPQLGALADNGGSTLTQSPAENSPVVNAGVSDPGAVPLFDQRGEARLFGGNVDLGAVELQGSGLAATGVDSSVPILLMSGVALMLLGLGMITYRIRRPSVSAR